MIRTALKPKKFISIDKTGNNWDSRDNFVIKNQKYQIVETASETDAEKVSTVAVSKPKAAVPEPPSKLDDKTQSLVHDCV